MIHRTEVLGVGLGDVTVEMAVHVWEPKNSRRSVLCLHGFAGNGRDFAPLAEVLGRTGITVIAPDLIGRGKSSFLGHEAAYSAQAYLACISAAAELQKPLAGHLGTSWGGVLLTTWLAALGWPSRGAVLNDLPLRSGPDLSAFRTVIQTEAKLRFESFAEAEAQVIGTRGVGYLDRDAQRRFAEGRIMEFDGQWRMAYDPAAASDFGLDVSYSLLPRLAKASAPVLLTYGKDSAFAQDPELVTLVAANPRLHLVKDMDDERPPKLMKLGQALQVAGWFGLCLPT